MNLPMARAFAVAGLRTLVSENLRKVLWAVMSWIIAWSFTPKDLAGIGCLCNSYFDLGGSKWSLRFFLPPPALSGPEADELSCPLSSAKSARKSRSTSFLPTFAPAVANDMLVSIVLHKEECPRILIGFGVLPAICFGAIFPSFCLGSLG